jgi:hypothetical protein
MQIFDLDAWRQIIVSAFQQLGDNLVAFFPSLVGTLVLLLVGWGVSKSGEAIARRALQRLGFDRESTRVRLPDMLSRAGIESPPSRIFGRVVFWIVMMTFVLSAVETLGLTAATTTLDRLVGYLPNVIAAGLILFVGLLVGKLARGLVESGALVADVARGEHLGAASGGMVFIFFCVLALEQLGVETTLLILLTTVFVGAATLTLGIAFALGAHPVIAHILAGHFLRQSLSVGASVEVDGRAGQVERVGPVETLLKGADRSWSIPNSALLDEVILR